MKKVFKYLFFIILGLFSLGQIERIQLTKVVVFYLHDLFIITWICLVSIKHHSQLHQLIKKYFFNKITLGLLVISSISLILNYLSYNFSIIPLLYISRAILYSLFGLSIPIVIGFNKTQYRLIWIIIGLIIAILGLIQYLWVPDTRFLQYLGWDDHLYRLISTQLDPNFTGIILVISFLLIQSIWHKQTWLRVTGSLILISSTLLTYSRASFLSFIISSLILFIISQVKSYNKNIFLPLMIGLFIILIPLLPRPEGEGVKLERTASITARVESNHNSLKKLKPRQWIIGTGLFNYQVLPTDKVWPNTAHFPNNLVVFLVSSIGILGLIVSLVIIFKVGKYLYQQDIYLFTAFLAILIHSQFNHTLFQPFVWLWLCSQLFMVKKTKI